MSFRCLWCKMGICRWNNLSRRVREVNRRLAFGQNGQKCCRLSAFGVVLFHSLRNSATLKLPIRHFRVFCFSNYQSLLYSFPVTWFLCSFILLFWDYLLFIFCFVYAKPLCATKRMNETLMLRVYQNTQRQSFLRSIYSIGVVQSRIDKFLSLIVKCSYKHGMMKLINFR